MSSSPAYEWNATHRPCSEMTGPDAAPNVVFGGPASEYDTRSVANAANGCAEVDVADVHVTDLTDVEVVGDVASVAADVGLAGVVGNARIVEVGRSNTATKYWFAGGGPTARSVANE